MVVLVGVGVRGGRGLGYLLSAYYEDTNRCKHYVSLFEKCAIMQRNDGGRDSPLCQEYMSKLESQCGQFRSSWGDWWSNELKERHCAGRLRSYLYCVHKYEHGGKNAPVCVELLDYYEAGCGKAGRVD